MAAIGNNNGKIELSEIRAIMNGKRPARDEKEIAKASVDADGNVKVYESTIEALADKLVEEQKDKLTPVIVETIAKDVARSEETLAAKLDKQNDEQRAELMKLAESTRRVEIKTPKGNKKIDGVTHENFELLVKTVAADLPVFMVGPAGTGKTHSAQLAAESLGLDFYSISVGSQTSKSDLIGYMSATGTYISTAFRKAFEHGGVFLLDEADAGNSNVLILLNAALSNGYMAFPDGMIHAHDDFRLIATANTFGTGASRQYVGRNQLDAATIDRFTNIVWEIDERIEAVMAGADENGKRWLNVVRAVRRRVVDEMELRVVISPRATQRGAKLLAAGVDFRDVLEMALIGNIPAGEKAGVKSIAEATWNK